MPSRHAFNPIQRKVRYPTFTDKIFEITMLQDKADSYARSLSGGMKRRLLVAKALVHRPPILILDEPTAGVDVDLRQQLLENIQQLNKQGVTIILTTHYLQEAQQLCDRIAIINNGELIALDKTENLLNNILTKKLSWRPYTTPVYTKPMSQRVTLCICQS